jgi:hypothetical protein
LIEDVFRVFRELKKLSLDRKDRSADRPIARPKMLPAWALVSIRQMR